MTAPWWTLSSWFWLTVIIYLSFFNPTGKGEVHLFFPNEDKIGHFIFYGILFFLVAQSFRLDYEFSKSPVWAFVFCLLIGIVIELIQGGFTSHRVGDWKDALANIAGSGVVYFFYNKRIIHV